MEGVEAQDSLLVRKIENGTVIDHIPAWKSELVVKALRLDRLKRDGSDISVAILQNVMSKRLGRKDLIKIDRWYVDENEADILCLILTTATINYIKGWRATKYIPKVPDRIEGKIRCPELLCISNGNREPVTTVFRTLKQERMLQCYYCDTLIGFEKIPDYVRT